MEKLPKIERQIHWVKMNSDQDHCWFQFCYFLSGRFWGKSFPLSQHQFPHLSNRDERPRPPTEEKGHVDKDVTEKESSLKHKC